MKKTIVALLIVSLSFGLFAQTSKTASVTNSLFKTDVDYFMNVNNFNKVNPENAFLYLGYNASSFDFGFAKQLKPLYLGFFFDGRLNNFTSTTTTTGPNGNSTNTFYDSTIPNTGLKFDTLLGFSNFALKYSFKIDDNSVYKPSHTASTNDYDNQASFVMNNVLTLGFNTKTEKASFTPNFSIGLSTKADQHDVSINGVRTFTDSSVNTVSLSASTGIGLEKKNNLKNDFNGTISTSFDLFPSVTSVSGATEVKQFGAFNNGINLTLGYTLSYFATDKFTLKGKVSATAKTVFSGASKSTTVNGTTTEADPVVTSSSLILSPAVYLGAQYQLKPTFALNFGLNFTTYEPQANNPNDPAYFAGLCRWKSTISTPKNGDATFTSEYAFQPGNMHVSWASGFDWKVAKVLDLDFDWEILPDLIGSTFTVSKTGNFWDVLGSIVFHRIYFGISAKF